MNVSTKTMLLDLLEAEERRIRQRFERSFLVEDLVSNDQRQVFHNEMARLNDARRLVEQSPEEPRP